MLSDSLFRYLCNLGETGKVVAIVGGPLCSTVSRLRERGVNDKGPRVVRARAGPGRFGLEGLSASEQRQVDEHSVLFFRMKALYFIAERHGAQPVLYVCEQPMDPAEYAEASGESASFWAWPEVQRFQDQYRMRRASCSQGFFGHVATKPTTLLTNSWSLFKAAHGCHSKPKNGEYLKELEARIQQAQSWSKLGSGAL